MDFYDAMGGLGGARSKPVPTPPFRLAGEMAGPMPPQGAAPQPREQFDEPFPPNLREDYYAPERNPTLQTAIPIDQLGSVLPATPRPPVNAQPGKTFIDRIEDDGTAVLLVPKGNDYDVQNVPAQQGWKEGMYIDMPTRQPRRPPRKRRAVP